MVGKRFQTAGPRRASVLCLCGAFFLVIWAVLASRTAGHIAAGAGAIVLLLIAWRFYLLGIETSAEGFAVVQAFRTRRYSWSDAERFDNKPFQNYPYMGCVVLRSGKTVWCIGLGTRSRPKSKLPQYEREVQEKISALNEILAAQSGLGVNA